MKESQGDMVTRCAVVRVLQKEEFEELHEEICNRYGIHSIKSCGERHICVEIPWYANEKKFLIDIDKLREAMANSGWTQKD